MLIRCPHCGPRDHTEFAYGREAQSPRPGDAAPLESWVDYVYLRDNPCGEHAEYWQHLRGCRSWILVRRDTLTHAVLATEPAQPGERP